MKRSFRVLAVSAPFAGVILWFASGVGVSSPATSSMLPNSTANDAEHGRTRDLPQHGPIAAPGVFLNAADPEEGMMPMERVRELMPNMDPRMLGGGRLIRALPDA